MKRFLAMALALLGAMAQAASFVDDGGRTFVLDRPAQRIVSLAPSLTELVYAVGAGPSLVGVDRASDHPPEAKAVPRTGDHARVDIERIVALKPDLVLAWRHGNPSRELAQLQALGLPLFHLEPRRLDDVPRALERLGALTGRVDQGASAAQRLRAELAALRERYGARRELAVFYQVWRDPLLTLNHDHLVSDVITLCGGRNVFGGLPQLVPPLSQESVVAARPEVILATRPQESGSPGPRRATEDESLRGWMRFTSIPAVQRGALFTIAGDVISRQGPRIAEGARAVCEALDLARAGLR